MSSRTRSTPHGADTRRFAAAFALGLAALCASPGPARAAGRQDGSPPAREGHGDNRTPPQVPTAAEQRERVSRLTRMFHAAAADARQSAARLTDDSGLDTVRAGSLLVLVEPAHEALAREAADRAWDVLDARYGSAAARLRLEPLIVRIDSTSTHAGDTTTMGIMLTAGQAVRRPVPLNSRRLTQHLVHHATVTMRSEMDPALRAWLGTYGALGFGELMFERAYEDLATSPSRVARGCLLGELADCREALAPGHQDDPASRWYDAPHRRTLATSRRWQLRASSPASYDACLAGDDAACDEVLRRLPPNEVPTPLSTLTRHSLVYLAVEVGGRDAFSRLLDHAGEPLDVRVSTAAGIPPDSLFGVWRSRILEAQPRRGGVPGSTGTMALVWTAVFGFLATRSTRWR